MRYFKLPDLGEGLTEAEIVEWHVQAGDRVTTEHVLVSVETAKAIVEVPAPQDGEIAALFGQVGDVVHVGEPLVEFAGEEPDDGATVVGEVSRGAAGDAPQRDHFLIGSRRGPRGAGGKASPAIRALAKRLGVDLAKVTPGGKNGVVTSDDVERAHQLQQSHGASETLRGVRRTMAQNMEKARAQVAQVTVFDDADIHEWPTGTDPTMRLVDAIGRAAAAEPQLNAWFDGEAMSLRIMDKVDLGIAVDTPDGLFVPVLRDITRRTMSDWREGLDRLRADVRARKIPPEELRGATLTLSNFGTIAGRYATPMVVPPTVAILGAGVVRDEARPVGTEIQIRRILPLSLAFDHRAATGGEAARFLKAVVDALAVPQLNA